MKLINSIGLVLALAGACKVNAQWANVGSSPLTTANGAYTNIVKDNGGNYYVSYYGGSITKGNVKKYDGTTWTYLGDSTVGVTPSFATYNSLGVNSAGEVFYSFQDGGNGSKISVKKYSPSTSSWSDIGVAISANVVNYQNLRIVPSTGYPVISYKESGGIYVKRYDGTSWVNVGANPFSTTNANHSLFIGKGDTVFIAIQSGSDYSVYKNVASATTASWQLVGSAAFASGGSSNQFTVSLTGDTSNNLYMAYRGLSTSSGKIMVSKFDGTSWAALGTQGFSTGDAEHISIAVGANGNPYVSYRDNTLGKNAVAQWAGGTSWYSLGTVSTNIGNYNSLIVNNSGNPVIAFCDGTGVSGGLVTVQKYTPNVNVDSIDVITQGNVPAAITTNGGTLQMQAVIYPGNTANQNVTWSIVPGTGTASISTSGLVTATTNGTVYAKAVSVTNPAKYDSLLVTISGQVVNVDSIDVITQSNVPATITTNAGTLQMQAVFHPSNVTNQNVTWSIVPGTGTASISASGMVTAMTNGTVYAKAVSVANPAKYDSLLVTISGQVVNVDSMHVITQGNVPAAITTNAGTLQMQAVFYPANATNQNVTWSIIPGTGTASISASGVVTAMTNGTVYAKAVSVANPAKYDSLLVTISGQVVNVDSIHVITQGNVPAAITTNAGTLQMQAVFYPANATNQNVTWSIIPGTGSASVSSGGLVTATANGSVYVKAVSVANTAKADSMLVTISGQQGTGILLVSGTKDFTVYPSPATDKITVSITINDETAFRILNLGGEVVKKGYLVSAQQDIDIAALKSGMYFLQVFSGKEAGVARFIKN